MPLPSNSIHQLLPSEFLYHLIYSREKKNEKIEIDWNWLLVYYQHPMGWNNLWKNGVFVKYFYSIIICAKWWIVRKLKKYLVKTKVFSKIEWFFKSDSTQLCIVRLYGGIDSICLAFTMAIYFPSEWYLLRISLPIQKLVDFSFSNCVKKEISPRCNCLWEEGTLISLINVEVGINVEGVQKLPNH